MNCKYELLIHNQLIYSEPNHATNNIKTNKKKVKKMMKKTIVKKDINYTIDLTKIDGDGAFSCPKCETLISPDDETEDTYQIVQTKVKDDELAELILTCKKCGSTMKLTGFMAQPAV